MARGVEKVTTTRRVEIKEDTRHHDDLLLQTGLEEVETVGNSVGETLEVEPAKENVRLVEREFGAIR